MAHITDPHDWELFDCELLNRQNRAALQGEVGCPETKDTCYTRRKEEKKTTRKRNETCAFQISNCRKSAAPNLQLSILGLLDPGELLALSKRNSKASNVRMVS